MTPETEENILLLVGTYTRFILQAKVKLKICVDKEEYEEASTIRDGILNFTKRFEEITSALGLDTVIQKELIFDINTTSTE